MNPTAPPDDPGAPLGTDALLTAVLEIERHVASQGWDQPTLLFALADSDRLRAEQPQLAEQLGLASGGPALTTFEQPAPPDDEELGGFLARIAWPEQVVGAALVVERLVLPPEAEDDVVASPNVAAAARAHPLAQDMRIVVGVGRGGATMCALRLRSADSDDAVLTGADLVPDLAAALLATFE